MKFLKAFLCLICITGCSQGNRRFISNVKVDDVQNEHILVPEDAASLSRTQQDIHYTDRTTIVTTYRTSRSVAAMKDYYQHSMRDHEWEPHFILAGAQDIQPDDLIFGKAGQDGEYPGDRIIYRNVIISVRRCNEQTCVTIKDIVHPTTIPEGLN